jgi:hypothetical protein
MVKPLRHLKTYLHFIYLTITFILVSSSFASGQTTVYIDPSYTGSTQNGTIQYPYKSWNSVSWVNGNTYLQKAGTTFNTSTCLLITSKHNITLGSYGSGSKPKIVSSGDNTIKVIDITSSYNMVVTGLEVYSTTGQVTAAVIIDGTGSSNNLIDNCSLHDSQWGIRILTTSSGNRILNSQVYNTQDDGIYIKDVPNIEIAYCNIYNVNLKYFINPDQSYSSGDNIQIASTNNHNFNIHHNTLDHSSTGNKFCFIAWGNNYTGVLEHNTMIGNSDQVTSCIYLSPTTGSVTVRYNSITHGNYGIYAYVANFNVYYNNFVGNRTAIAVLNNYHLRAENNIFYNNTIACISGFSGSNVVAKNNIFYISGSAKALSTSGSLTSDYNTFNTQSANFINGHSTLSSWQSASGQDLHSFIGNPQFVNPSGNNFELQPNSPCINKGVICGYNQDFYGNPVPQGNSSDIGYYEYTQTVVNHPPVIQNQTFSVPENSAVNTVVGQVIATDPDTGDVLTYSITGGNEANNFSINSTNGVISVVNSQNLNFESNEQFNLQVSVHDNANLSSSATVTINVQNVNEDPQIDDQGFNIDENSNQGTEVGTIIASDPDQGQQLSYTIVSGNTGNTFSLDQSSGLLTVISSQLLNFEENNLFQLTIGVQDDGPGLLSDNAVISINLNNLNETPVAGNQNFTVNSTATNGTIVGQVNAYDPDYNQVLTYFITSGNDYNTFLLDYVTGVISVANSAGLSGSTNQFILNVIVTDNGNPQLTTNLIATIDVNQINTAPIVQSQNFSVAENSVQTTIVGQVIAQDLDYGQTLSYSIVSGNTNNAFAITETGLITVLNQSELNYEATQSYSLVIRVTDNGNPPLSSYGTTTIIVTDVNEAPVIPSGQSFDLPIMSPNGYVVGTVIASDPDYSQSLSYEITAGNTQNVLAINSSTGELTVANSAALRKLANKMLRLTIRVTDNGNPSLNSEGTVLIRLIKKLGNNTGSNRSSIYPNPSADGIFKLSIPLTDNELTSIKISDMSGNLLYESSFQTNGEYEINLSSHPKGFYLLQIINNDTVELKKLIIQ